MEDAFETVLATDCISSPNVIANSNAKIATIKERENQKQKILLTNKKKERTRKREREKLETFFHLYISSISWFRGRANWFPIFLKTRSFVPRIWD